MSTPVHKEPDAAWIAEEGTAFLLLEIESVGCAELVAGGEEVRAPRLDIRIAEPGKGEGVVIHLLLNPEAEEAFIGQVREAYKFARGE